MPFTAVPVQNPPSDRQQVEQHLSRNLSRPDNRITPLHYLGSGKLKLPPPHRMPQPEPKVNILTHALKSVPPSPKPETKPKPVVVENPAPRPTPNPVSVPVPASTEPPKPVPVWVKANGGVGLSPELSVFFNMGGDHVSKWNRHNLASLSDSHCYLSVGHSDPTGGPMLVQGLSDKRADAVAKAMRKTGLRVKAVGVGAKGAHHKLRLMIEDRRVDVWKRRCEITKPSGQKMLVTWTVTRLKNGKWRAEVSRVFLTHLEAERWATKIQLRAAGQLHHHVKVSPVKPVSLSGAQDTHATGKPHEDQEQVSVEHIPPPAVSPQKTGVSVALPEPMMQESVEKRIALTPHDELLPLPPPSTVGKPDVANSPQHRMQAARVMAMNVVESVEVGVVQASQTAVNFARKVGGMVTPKAEYLARYVADRAQTVFVETQNRWPSVVRAAHTKWRAMTAYVGDALNGLLDGNPGTTWAWIPVTQAETADVVRPALRQAQPMQAPHVDVARRPVRHPHLYRVAWHGEVGVKQVASAPVADEKPSPPIPDEKAETLSVDKEPVTKKVMPIKKTPKRVVSGHKGAGVPETPQKNHEKPFKNSVTCRVSAKGSASPGIPSVVIGHGLHSPWVARARWLFPNRGDACGWAQQIHADSDAVAVLKGDRSGNGPWRTVAFNGFDSVSEARDWSDRMAVISRKAANSK